MLKKYIIIPAQNLYMSSITYIDDYIKHEILGPKYLGENLLKITLNIKFIKENACIKYFVILDMLPRIIFVIVFLYDVIIKQQLICIYIFSWILLIPLIFNYILYTFKGFLTTNIQMAFDEFLLFFDVHYKEICFEEVLKNYQKTSLNKKHNFTSIKYIFLKKQVIYQNLDQSLDFYLNQLHIFTPLFTTIVFFYQIKNLNLYKVLSIMLYTIYFCIWLYIFLYQVY